MGVEGETILLTRYCFSLIRLGIYALRLCLVCVVDVRVRLRSSVGILDEALDLTADLCTALFLHPVYNWALLHAAWLSNRFIVKQGTTAFEKTSGRTLARFACLARVC